MGYTRKNYGIYWANTMGYIGLRLLVILLDKFGKTFGIYLEKYGKYLAKPMGFMGLSI